MKIKMSKAQKVYHGKKIEFEDYQNCLKAT